MEKKANSPIENYTYPKSGVTEKMRADLLKRISYHSTQIKNDWNEQEYSKTKQIICKGFNVYYSPVVRKLKKIRTLKRHGEHH